MLIFCTFFSQLNAIRRRDDTNLLSGTANSQSIGDGGMGSNDAPSGESTSDSDRRGNSDSDRRAIKFDSYIRQKTQYIKQDPIKPSFLYLTWFWPLFEWIWKAV